MEESLVHQSVPLLRYCHCRGDYWGNFNYCNCIAIGSRDIVIVELTPDTGNLNPH